MIWLRILLFFFLLIGCKQEGKEPTSKESPLVSPTKELKGFQFEEKITNSNYNWSFFERVGGEECWDDFEKANYQAFELRKNGPGPRQSLIDFAACRLHFYILPNGTHILTGNDSGEWFEENPKAITKLECNKNICEMSYADYLSYYPKNDKPDRVVKIEPRQGKIKFIILDSKHFQLVDYPKHMLERDRNYRGMIYRYFPSAHNLSGDSFCQMDKEELLKNREIYPPKQIECINPDDLRKAAEQ
ncbi:hypothetical protein [Leptospira idonii]|uniref:Lipoprotein n=1 Tax=Leptospira idonii TaxID=1193500 RepID=A0A4R9LWH5_9LEPT|nr:hypothetical protein [Leptospira idonii]TGN17513.1 hypothetical protein EHS15_16980 [Leptospira idonii]